jgi:uncharacterized protein (DUF169 family)
MPSIADQSRKLEQLLGLGTPPIALAFSAKPPGTVKRTNAPAPASCSYWGRASAGELFYTTADDHHGCAVGSHTHGVPFTETLKAELNTMLGQMFELGYLSPDEVGAIPTRKAKLEVVTYGPLASLPVAPDVVLMRASARAAMLFSEAAHAVGIEPERPALRPACTLLPIVEGAQHAGSSFGCIGNRVYTGLGDGEGWLGLPGSKLEAVVTKLETIVAANQALEAFHRARL